METKRNSRNKKCGTSKMSGLRITGVKRSNGKVAVTINEDRVVYIRDVSSLTFDKKTH